MMKCDNCQSETNVIYITRDQGRICYDCKDSGDGKYRCEKIESSRCKNLQSE